MTEIGAPRPATLPVMPATAAVCPYLLASDGRWRASTPTREHRCTVVTPPAMLAPEKQRRLCLSPDHVRCSTYIAAVADVEGSIDTDAAAVTPDGRRRGRAVTRTVPLVLDHGRMAIGFPGLRTERSAGQGGLVALMGIAFGAIVIARLSAGGPDVTPAAGAGAAAASPSHAASPASSPVPAASDVPTRTLVPTEVEPTPVPGRASVAPPAAAAPTTYKVKSGDTLGGIARKFGTTVRVLQDLNGIDNPRLLRVGQVLDLP